MTTMTTDAATTDTTSTDTSADADSAADTIAVLREQIDSLDTALIALVAERMKVSRRIQQTRMNAGGTRVELGREREVLAAYRDGLGAQGPALADAVLQVCRGSR